MKTMPTDSSFPTHLGSYRLERRLGRGGMGEVFLAWDGRLERHVAIKRILNDPPPDAQARARFRREARAVARLNHPAIVQVFELLEADDGDCLVMEHLEGRGLTEVIAAGGLDVEDAVRLAAEIADGLAEAHAKGLIHRDLKPENVRLSASGRAKILDFGLARLLWDDTLDREPLEQAVTRSGMLIGTVHAMSPEQASGRPVDHRSDLFALGGLLYEMLTGRAPFRGDNVLDTLRRVTGEAPEPLAERCPGVPAELLTLVEDLLAKDPADRPQNARLVVDALERLRDASADGPAEAAPVRRESAEPPIPARDVADDQPTGEWPALVVDEATDGGWADGGSVETVVRALVVADVVDRTSLLERLGDARAADVLGRHDRTVRELAVRHGGIEIDRGDGFLILFERPVAAVAFGLAYHQRLDELSSEVSEPWPDDLRARVGVHLGEVQLRRNPPEAVSRGARPIDVEGLARALVTSLAALAAPRQTLLSRSAFEVARRATEGDERWDDGLRWLAHGDYRIDGLADAVAVYEVGVVDIAPLAAPVESPTVRRMVSIADEQVLGWRPAPGQVIPRRPSWRLDEQLGEGGFGEVWLARHASGERRVFKFCFEASKLRALRREVTLFRVLKEALGHRQDIARVLDWHFDTAPFFVESEHSEGGDLVSWAAARGGLGAVPLATRVDLMAQVADALSAAHSVGVLHQDIKPENILITEEVDGRPRIRLTDFGVGGLIDRSVLADSGLGADGSGFTETVDDDPSTVGSRRYLAPERLEGRPASVQGDLYSLGVVLYQATVGDLARVLTPSWRRDIDDPLLADDIAALVDGAPERRPTSAGPVAERLRALDARRAERREVEEATKRRRRLRWASAVAAVLLVLVSALLVQAHLARQEAERLRTRAETAREQAETLIGFMLGDLQRQLHSIGRLDALEGAGEQALSYFDGLDAEDLGTRTLARHAAALNQMGDVRMAQGDLDAAQALFDRSLDRSRELYDRDPTDEALFELGQSHFWAANVHWRRGEYDAAMPDAEAYLRRSQELSERDPSNAGWLLEVSFGHNNVADLLLARHNPPLALEHFRRSLAVVERLVALDSTRADWRHRQATAQLKIAEVAYEQGQIRGAADAADQAIDILETLVVEDPEDSRWRRRLALAHDWATDYRLDLGELDAAERHSRRNLDLVDALHRSDPSHVEWRALLVGGHALRGEVLDYLGRPGDAESALLAALDVAGPTTPEDDFSCQMQAKALTAMADHRLATGRASAARQSARHALELLGGRFEPSDLRSIRFFVNALVAEGEALAAAGRAADAETAWRRALDLLAARLEGADGTTTPPDLLFLARVHRLLGDHQEAEAPIYTLLGMGARHPRLLACCGDTMAPDRQEPISTPGGAR